MPLDDPDDQSDLWLARQALENPGFLMNATNQVVGRPIELAIRQLPNRAIKIVNTVTDKALHAALRIALSSMDLRRPASPRPRFHRGAAMLVGGVGGAFGLLALSIELPVSTTIMLRSIADIARAQGEDLRDPEARLACIEVFALGGRKTEEGAESGYFAVRTVLARSISEAAAYFAEKGAAEKGAPILAKLVSKIAEKFAPQVAEKVAAESLPVLGAIGGASLNWIFMTHFQKVAHGHFTVRRLERKHGAQRIRMEYELIGRGRS